MRYPIDPDGTRMAANDCFGDVGDTCGRACDPYLDAAVANDELPRGLPRSDIHLWLGDVTKMVMRGLEDGDGDLKRYRSILRRFVAPAFAGSDRPMIR